MYPRHNQTAIHFETQELIARIDTLATDMNKQTKTVLDNSERLARIETLIVHGSVVATTSNILGTSNETSKPTCVDFFTLNNTFMTIEANIEKQTEMTGELLHNYTARLTELETDMNAHQNAINQLSRGVSEFNDTVEQLVALETQQNDTMNTNEEIISRLEADIELHDTRLKKLETRDIRNNVTLETHSSELAKLHRDQSNDREMTTNLTFRVERLETVEERQRPSEELENRLIQLGSDINRTQVDIKGNDDKIRLLEENITSIIDIVNGYNKTVETVKVNKQFLELVI